MGFYKKLISFSSFFLRSTLLTIKLKNKIDIIYATSTPLTVGIPAIIAKYLIKKKYIFEVRDLWPEAPIQMGIIKNEFLIKILKRVEKKIYESAELIIALSPGMKEGITARGIKPKKVRIIPNMAKPDIFYPRNKKKSIITEFRLNDDQINIIYFGAIGKSNGLIEFVKLFKKIKSKRFRLIIVGNGSDKENLKEYVLKENLINVNIFESYPMNKISDLVNCCDISLCCFADIPILYTNSPNKFFDSLSAGKPIIINSNGWTRKLIEKYKCGFYYNPKDINSFNQMIFSINKIELKLMGENSRKLALSKFDKDKLTNKIVTLVNNL